MPTAPKRACPTCGLVITGKTCQTCARHQEQRRGTAHARGYTYRQWQPFRRKFIASLVYEGILPVCGAALPMGPVNRDSRCRDHGIDTFTSADGSSLHLDHEPPLQAWERSDPSRVCDPTRIVLKCQACHQRKTAREAAFQ
jgi:hypothetical protein